MGPFGFLKKKLFAVLSALATKPMRPPGSSLCDYDEIAARLRHGDLILIDGRTRASTIIQTVTLSSWSHAALCIGRLDAQPEDLQKTIRKRWGHADDDILLIEAEMGAGVVISALSRYAQEHLRLCQPWGLDERGRQAVVDFCLERVGRDFDERQILDMLRFFLPYSVVPRRWRSSLFFAGQNHPQREVCSTLLAEAYAHAGYPILPPRDGNEDTAPPEKRNKQLVAPSDFDYSPYFDIVKYPLPGDAHYPRRREGGDA